MLQRRGMLGGAKCCGGANAAAASDAAAMSNAAAAPPIAATTALSAVTGAPHAATSALMIHVNMMMGIVIAPMVVAVTANEQARKMKIEVRVER